MRLQRQNKQSNPVVDLHGGKPSVARTRQGAGVTPRAALKNPVFLHTLLFERASCFCMTKYIIALSVSGEDSAVYSDIIRLCNPSALIVSAYPAVRYVFQG